jgi:hypothetical protein
VQVVIALIVTPEGFPLAYEVLAGLIAKRQNARGKALRRGKVFPDNLFTSENN